MTQVGSQPVPEKLPTGILGALAGVGLVAGLAGGFITALLHQGKASATAIENAAIEAAIADGLLPPGERPPGFHVAAIPVPFGDGIYFSDGSVLLDEPTLDEPTVAEPFDGTTRRVEPTVREPTVLEPTVLEPTVLEPTVLEPTVREPTVREPTGGEPTGGVPVEGTTEHAMVLCMLGDSTAVGYGTRRPEDLPGAMLAVGLAQQVGRPVRLSTLGLVGCGAADLARQVGRAVAQQADLVVIVTGANDISDKVPPWRSAAMLGEAVAALRSAGVPVVVGTCPDFGVIAPIPQPLRSVLSTWSHRLAALQERAVIDAGGRAVAIGRLVSPEFASRPELFAGDHFHPSGAGYARAVTVLLPQVVAALQDPATDSVT